MNELTGKLWCFGDHVNTDVIHPPQFFSLDPERVKSGLFHNYDPTLQARLSPGDLLIAGKNFGCGSSRETSIRSLKLNRVGAIVAVDFARIFFRNATNNGIPCLTFADPADLERARAAERASLSIERFTLTTDRGDVLPLAPAPAFVVRIWSAGGLLETLSPAAGASSAR